MKTEQKSNPALKDLEVFIGTWNVELVFPAQPDTVNRALVSFEWIAENNFILLRFPVGNDAPMLSKWLIGRDESSDSYVVLYSDTRDVSRVYQMTFADSEWRMWRDAEGFSQRFVGTLSQDNKTITAKWENSSDGTTWELDFNVTYTRTN